MNTPQDLDSPTAGDVNQNLNIESQDSQNNAGPSGWFKEFFATFLTIFAAEFGDKTQIATLMISAESHAPWVVFLGAASALIATSLVGVLVGRWLAKNVSEATLEIVTGASLLMIAVLLLWDMVQI